VKIWTLFFILKACTVIQSCELVAIVSMRYNVSHHVDRQTVNVLLHVSPTVSRSAPRPIFSTWSWSRETNLGSNGKRSG